MLKHCLEKGITIYSVKDNLFVKDLRDIQSFTNLLISAQAESDAISHRVLQSIEYRKSLGAYFGKEKFGYSIIKENNIKKLVPLLDEIQVINLIQKLYYGCQKCEIENLLLTINKQKTKIKIPDILLYGNYSSADVAYFLNLHRIFKRGEQWTTYTINKVINQNVKYINKKYNLTDNLNDELITIISNKNTSDISKNVRTINQLFLEINGYKLTEKLETYKTFKTRWDIMNFLNKYHVNFRVWTIDDIEEIDEEPEESTDEDFELELNSDSDEKDNIEKNDEENDLLSVVDDDYVDIDGDDISIDDEVSNDTDNDTDNDIDGEENTLENIAMNNTMKNKTSKKTKSTKQTIQINSQNDDDDDYDSEEYNR